MFTYAKDTDTKTIESGYQLPSSVNIKADSVILLSLGATEKQDSVIYEKNADVQKAPSALVRLMVGLTAIDIAKNKEIDIEKQTGKYTVDIFNKELTGTGMSLLNLKYNDDWTIKDLLTMSMIQSAGDAAVTLAYALAENQNEFVAKMNSLATKIGCKDTSFGNVTGLDRPGQITTARECALIMRKCMESPILVEVMSLESFSTQSKQGTKINITSTNHMLRKASKYYYSSMQFGRTGRTSQAGSCFASVAMDSGYQYLCVVLGSPEQYDHFSDTRKMYDWVYKSFSYRTLLSKSMPMNTDIELKLSWDKDKVQLMPKNDIAAIVPNDLDESSISVNTKLFYETVNAPISKGDVLGEIQLTIQNGKLLGKTDLVASQSIERSNILALFYYMKSAIKTKWFIGGTLLLALLIIIYVIVNIVHNKRRRNKHMKTVRRHRRR